MIFITDIDTVSEDLTTAVLRDISDYGGSNPLRNTLALYNYFYKVDADGNLTQITIDNSAPTTVTSWDFDLPTPDGVFLSKMFGVTLWTAGTYPIDTVRYYNGGFWISNASTSGTPGTSGWDAIADLLPYSDNATLIYYESYSWCAAHSESGKLGDKLADFGPSVRDGRCRDYGKASSVLFGAAMIFGAFTNFRRADYTNAQKDIDFVQANYA